MNPQVAAFLVDALVLVHLLFVAFVMGGGLLLLRWPRLVWLHLPPPFGARRSSLPAAFAR